MLAGVQPAALFRSDDRGRTWKKLDTGIKPYVPSGFYAGDAAATAAVQDAGDVKQFARVTETLPIRTLFLWPRTSGKSSGASTAARRGP